MATPIAPSELLPAVVLPEDDEGIAVVKAHVIFPAMFTAWMTYAFDEDGNFTTAFAADLCAITCAEVLGEAPLEIPSPNQWRESVPSLTGDKCEKFRTSLNIGNLFYDWYSAVYNEDKTFTDDFKAQICSIDCPVTPSGSRLSIPTPSQFLALVPPVGGDFCTKFANASKFPQLVAQFFEQIYKEDRKFTEEFKGQYCALGCDSGVVVIPPGGTGETLPKPTLTATTGLFGKIRWSWTEVPGAIYYNLWLVVDGNRVQLIYGGGQLFFDDTSPAPGECRTAVAIGIAENGETSPYSDPVVGCRPLE